MAENRYHTLPAKRMGSGCLFFNDAGQVMLVKPNYKPGWEIPGGIVELDESPLQCCIREVQEELGLAVEIDRLLLLDYNPAAPPKTESLMFVFDGGVLTAAQIAQIKLQPSELDSYQFFSPADLPEDDLSPSLYNRVLRAWQQHLQKTTAYHEN